MKYYKSDTQGVFRVYRVAGTCKPCTDAPSTWEQGSENLGVKQSIFDRKCCRYFVYSQYSGF